MKIIGITGGVGSGKSEVLTYIGKNFDATVLQADEAAHLLMQPGQACYKPLLELLGPGFTDASGNFDRKKMSSVVFRDEKMRLKVNEIVHPSVKKYIRKAIEREEKQGTLFFFVEAALLIEDKYDEICDELWYIYADEETRMERLKQNRGYSEEKCRSIFRNQLSEEEFSDHCDFEIDNSDDFEKTKEQIQQKMQRMQIDEVM